MKKYMFIEFDRRNVEYSDVRMFNGDSLEDVVRKVLSEVYDMDDEEIDVDMNMKKSWKKNGNMIGSDGEEMSYLIVEIE